MWKILGLVVLLGTLVNVSEGKKTGISYRFHFGKSESITGSQLRLDVVIDQVKKMGFENILLPGLLRIEPEDETLISHTANRVPRPRRAEATGGIRLSVVGSAMVFSRVSEPEDPSSPEEEGESGTRRDKPLTCFPV